MSDLAKKVLAVSEKLKIKLDKDPVDFYSRRTKPLFTSPGTNSKGERIVFRVALSEVFNKHISREIEIYKTAAELKLDHFPKLNENGKEGIHYWLTYNYIAGEPSGNTYLFGSKTDYSKIFVFLENMNHLGKILHKDTFSVFSKDKYLNLVDSIADKDMKLRELYRSQIDTIKNGVKDWNYDSFVHGDFHPQNIFASAKTMVVIDWELSHFNLKPFDYSFLWIRSQNQEVRDEVMKILSNVPKSQIYFVFSVNILRDLFEWHQIMNGKNSLMQLDSASVDAKKVVDDLAKNLNFFVDRLKN
ncbi:MAG: phosphotransferase [Candidatus Berkelbacteria bacterium]